MLIEFHSSISNYYKIDDSGMDGSSMDFSGSSVRITGTEATVKLNKHTIGALTISLNYGHCTLQELTVTTYSVTLTDGFVSAIFPSTQSDISVNLN